MEHATCLWGPLFLRDLLMVARGRVSRMPYAGLVDVSGDEGERPCGQSVPGIWVRSLGYSQVSYHMGWRPHANSTPFG